MNESPPGHICVSETKHNPFIYVIIENTLNLILLLKCSWKSPYFWSPVFVLQQSHTSPLNYFLKDCYRFIFFLFRSYAILYSSRSIFRNFGIALLFADCQLAQSHLLWSSLPKQRGTENPHTLALWKPAAKAAGRVIDDTIRTQIYSQADASIVPGSRKGPIRWGETLNIALYNLLVSKGFMYCKRIWI